MLRIETPAERNYRRNKKHSEKLRGGYINGQGLGAAAVMRYGLCPMSFNGCEVIAVYNALIYLGREQPLCEIARFMERYKMLFGIFGCDPYRLGEALDRYGAAFERSGDISSSRAFIISYWTGRRFLSSIHTVFCEGKNDGIIIYNSSNKLPSARLVGSVGEITGGKKPIARYNII